VGFNFLKLIDLNFNYFASGNRNAGTGLCRAARRDRGVTGISQSGWNLLRPLPIASTSQTHRTNACRSSPGRI